MRGKVVYIISIIVIVIPWLFLLEAIPISYSQLSTQAEVIIESVMFLLLAAVVILLRKELKRRKALKEDSRSARTLTRILLVLAYITLFLMGLILVLIALSFSL